MTSDTRQLWKYLSEKSWENIIKRKTCPLSWEEFAVFEKELEIRKKISPTLWWKTYLLPDPTISPRERIRRKLLFRNNNYLYRNTCSYTWKPLISSYHQDAQTIVYHQDIWWSDKRDATNFWRPYDFSLSFTENFRRLQKDVPRYAVYNLKNTDSDYMQYVTYSDQCYMISWGRYSKNCLYWSTIIESEYCVDCMYTHSCQSCYQCVDIHKCTNCFWCIWCENCSNSSYLTNCFGCTFCYWCADLQQASYCIYNKQYTKEEYLNKISTLIFDQTLVPDSHAWLKIREWQNCYGNLIYTSSNILNWFETWDSKDVYHTLTSVELENAIDNLRCWKSSLVWESSNADYAYKVFTWKDNEHCKNCYYIDICYTSEYLFWCIWIRNKKYCIFNKEYPSQEYEQLMWRIINQMKEAWERGEFFDDSLSLFWYNESLAQDYYPMSKIWARNRWYKRLDKTYDPTIPANATVIERNDYSQYEWDALLKDERILRTVILCEETKRPYMIQAKEREFYLKHTLSPPSRHPEVRRKELVKKRPWVDLKIDTCTTCDTRCLLLAWWTPTCTACYNKHTQ